MEEGEEKEKVVLGFNKGVSWRNRFIKAHFVLCLFLSILILTSLRFWCNNRRSECCKLLVLKLLWRLQLLKMLQ